MALTDYVIMPGEDYQAICDAVREKRNETEVIKSGEIAGKIQGIEVLPKLQDKNVIPRAESQTVTADDGYDALGTVTVEGDAELLPENIKEGVNIFGVEGTLLYDETLAILTAMLTPKDTNSWSSFFANRSTLAELPSWYTMNTSRATDLSRLFIYCYKLRKVPTFDTRAVTAVNSMFGACWSLSEVPMLDLKNATIIASICTQNYELTVIPPWDIRSATNAQSAFNDMHKLTECWLRNIKTSIQVGSGTSWGHLLTLDSLIHLIYECRDTGSQKTLTVGSANLEKLANVYVRTIEVTDEMRAEDDLIDEKLPFEVCESTDEGAMLIVDYAVEKNWSIK